MTTYDTQHAQTWAASPAPPSTDAALIAASVDRVRSSIDRIFKLMVVMWVIVPIIGVGLFALLAAIGASQLGSQP